MSQELAFALQRLADESKPVRSMVLTTLSDIPRADMSLFRLAWAGLGTERRHELASRLVEQAESNIHLDFRAIFRDCLGDPDSRIRKLAVEGLWEDNRPSLVTPLMRLLRGDPSPAVRAAAAQTLGRFVLMGSLGDLADSLAADAEEALRAAWERAGETNEVRRRALEGLAGSSSSDLRVMIEVAYSDEDPLMRQSAVFAMGRSADRRWAGHILTELRDSDAPMRFEAAQAAGELALSAAVAPLIQLLDDADGNVSEAAALALGQIGGAQARRALKQCLTGDNERLAEAADEALAELTFNSEPVAAHAGSIPVGDDGQLAGRRNHSRSDLDDVTEDDEEDEESDEEDGHYDEELDDFDEAADDADGWDDSGDGPEDDEDSDDWN